MVSFSHIMLLALPLFQIVHGKVGKAPSKSSKSSKSSESSEPVCLLEGFLTELTGPTTTVTGEMNTADGVAYASCLTTVFADPVPNTIGYADCLEAIGTDFYAAPFFINRDTGPSSAFVFKNDGEASTGVGALYGEIQSGGDATDKLLIEYHGDDLLFKSVSELEYISYDFFPEACKSGSDPCPGQFYLNVYMIDTNPSTTGGGWYDCNPTFVPTVGPTGEWTNFKVSPNTPATDSRVNSQYKANNGGVNTCPNSLAEAADRGFILGNAAGFVFVVNMGDNSNSDDGMKGYIDNIIFKKTNVDTVFAFDFEG